jgi:rubrerythrin
MLAFNADEILEMAEQIERNGARFYRKAAASANDANAARTLRELAEWEDAHEQTFAAMRTELSSPERPPVLGDPDAEGAQYLRAFVDGKVFDAKADPADLLNGREALADVVRTAIGLEKDSIVFYSAMRLMVPPERGRNRLDDIIGQELDHIAVLNKLLR